MAVILVKFSPFPFNRRTVKIAKLKFDGHQIHLLIFYLTVNSEMINFAHLTCFITVLKANMPVTAEKPCSCILRILLQRWQSRITSKDKKITAVSTAVWIRLCLQREQPLFSHRLTDASNKKFRHNRINNLNEYTELNYLL